MYIYYMYIYYMYVYLYICGNQVVGIQHVFFQI